MAQVTRALRTLNRAVEQLGDYPTESVRMQLEEAQNQLSLIRQNPENVLENLELAFFLSQHS